MSNDNNLPKKTTNDLLTEKEQLAQELMALDGELTQELEERLFANSAALAAKTDALQWALARLENEEEFLKAQAKKLSDAAKARGNQVDRLKTRIKDLMLSHNIERISGDMSEFYLTKAKAKLVGEGLPDGFTKQTILIEADKDLIRDAIEEGRAVDGYSLQPSHALRTRIAVKKLT